MNEFFIKNCNSVKEAEKLTRSLGIALFNACEGNDLPGASYEAKHRGARVWIEEDEDTPAAVIFSATLKHLNSMKKYATEGTVDDTAEQILNIFRMDCSEDDAGNYFDAREEDPTYSVGDIDSAIESVSRACAINNKNREEL